MQTKARETQSSVQAMYVLSLIYPHHVLSYSCTRNRSPSPRSLATKEIYIKWHRSPPRSAHDPNLAHHSFNSLCEPIESIIPPCPPAQRRSHQTNQTHSHRSNHVCHPQSPCRTLSPHPVCPRADSRLPGQESYLGNLDPRIPRYQGM
jgi:hypothetical protein